LKKHNLKDLFTRKRIKISDLSFNTGQVPGLPKNPRFIRDQKFEAMCQSIREDPEYLEVREVLIYDYQGINVVIAGEMRTRGAKNEGHKDVPCKVFPEGTPIEKIRAYAIKDNAHYGEWDQDALANEWEAGELKEWGVDEASWGEGDNSLNSAKAEEDDYEEPEIETIKTDIVLGDLFEIGEHRLLCGDSTCGDTVAKLMNGEKADMVFTDPPYGISYSGKGIKGAAKENDFGEILGDNDTTIAFNNYNLISSLFENATLIYWGANYYPSVFPSGYGWLIWDKEKEGDLFSGAEIAFINKGVKVDIFRHQWHGMIKASEMGEKRLHPTQKPIALARFCFEKYNLGDIVADFFLGSGSTMVAAHQIESKCYGMELDPKYCDVIVRRMMKLDPELTVKRNGVDETNKWTQESN